MNLHVFTVYDSKANSFLQPIFAQTVAVGLRLFERACNDEKADFHQYAGDYTLFELGMFDQDTAKFDLHDTPVNHGLAITFIRKPE